MAAKEDKTPATNSNPVLSIDKEGCVFYSNEAGNLFLNEWKVKIGEKLPSSIADLVQRVISLNSPEKMETKIGNRVYLVIFSPLPEQECVSISGFDISDQKEVEGKLRENENKYQNIVETSVEGIWIFNSISETTYVNEKMAEMLGYSPEEMIGRFIWDFAYEEDKSIFQVKLANRKQGIDEVYELKLIRKDGSPVWFSVSAKGFFDDAGKFEGSVGMFTDITEGKKVEETLRESKARVESIFRSSPVGIGVVVDRIIKEANERLCEITGYSREELLGKSALMLYPTAEEYERVGLVKYSMILEHGTGYVETRWQRKDGSVVDILLSSSPIVPGDLSGEITFTALDITERKRAEETLAFERSQLLSIFDGMDDVVYVTDPYTYEVLYANKAMKEKFDGELIGGICYQEFQRRDSPCDFCTNQIILKEKGKLYHWEYYNPTVNRYFMIMDRIIKWPDGRDARLEIAKDITERKQLEEQTRQRAEELETLMNVVPVAIFIGHDPKCHNITGNLMANELYEAKLGENISANVSNLRRIFHNDIELTADELPMQKAAYKDIDVRNEELDWLLPSGERRAVIGSASPLHDAEGHVRGSISTFIDITERKQMEEALKKAHDSLEEKVKERTEELQTAYDLLKKSESNLAEAQEMAHIGSWEHDLRTSEVHWSDELHRIFGFKPQESKVNYDTFLRYVHPDDTFLSYVHPDDRNYVNNAVKETLKGKPLDINFRIIRANGEELIVHALAEVVFDEKNNPIQIKGTTQDITEIKKIEEALRKSEKRYRLLHDNLRDAFAEVTMDGHVIDFNNQFCEILGYPPNDIRTMSFKDLTPDRWHAFEDKIIREQVIPHGYSEIYEKEYQRKDGTTFPVELRTALSVDDVGQPISMWAIVRDITERKQAEERLRESEEKYRNIVETANEGIALISSEGIITYVNKKMADMLRYAVEEIVYKKIWDFVEEKDKSDVTTSFEKRRRGSNESLEIKLIRKDGSYLWTFINSKPLFDKDGKFIGALNLHTDITKRKEAEETLKIIQIARQKEIHHRIKNNLQVISSLLDLQADKFNNPKVIEAFRESQNRIVSMALIHEELYKGGTFETLNFSPYIEKLADTLFQTYRLGNTDISLSMDLEESIFFNMDTAVPLGIIVNELVSNSLKHAFPDREKGEIGIKLHREKSIELESKDSESYSTSTSFTLTISDNGIGIPENLDIENLDSLGMQLVTSLVDQLDGELDLKRDNGTEFTVRFKIIEKNE